MLRVSNDSLEKGLRTQTDLWILFAEPAEQCRDTLKRCVRGMIRYIRLWTNHDLEVVVVVEKKRMLSNVGAVDRAGRRPNVDLLHHIFPRVTAMTRSYLSHARGFNTIQLLGTMSTTTETITIPLVSLKLTTTSQEMDQPSHTPSHPAPKSQKQMTKAERREQQEAQRAAKVAAKASAVQPPTSKPTSSHKHSGSIGGKGAPLATSTPKKPGKGEPKEALHPGTQTDETPRGLRIFAHFGAPKPPVITKGDIHPDVIRLGLQFAEFKITGANARCIAMLSAFKTVRPRYSSAPDFRSSGYRSSKTM